MKIVIKQEIECKIPSKMTEDLLGELCSIISDEGGCVGDSCKDCMFNRIDIYNSFKEEIN